MILATVKYNTGKEENIIFRDWSLYAAFADRHAEEITEIRGKLETE